MTVRPLIEQWFPAAAVGAESLRERGASSALPPVNFLHVWWARRPLTSCRAAIAASLLPAWPSQSEVRADADCASTLKMLEEEFPGGEAQYRAWFLESIGILGDPVDGRRRIAAARITGEKLIDGGYGYKRAFTVSPSAETIERIRRLCCTTAAGDAVSFLDPFAGGGSIPFEAARLGLESVANELNPVAVAVLNGTVALPAQLGPDFGDTIRHWGDRWSTRVSDRLTTFFPKTPGDATVVAYIWAHTVPCPTTGRPTPLSPDYWLAKGMAGRSIAVKLTPDPETGLIGREIVEGTRSGEWGDRGTYKRGVGTSIWTQETFSGDYIREQAQAGHMSEMMLALCVTHPDRRGRQFRAPSAADLDAASKAVLETQELLSHWEIDDLIPTESIPAGWKTDEPRRNGIKMWRDMFSARQLLTTVTAIEELRTLVAEARDELGVERSKALNLYLYFALSKGLNYNSKMCAWHATRTSIANTFDRHDFSFKWSFAEFDGASALVPWAVDQIVDAYDGIARLAYQPKGLLHDEQRAIASIVLGSATDLPVESESVDAIVTDPPYYDNVMYAELSDFFYVWLKRAVRDSWPELTTQVLTDKEDEAVANPSLFRDVATAKGHKKAGEKSAADLADEHYEDLLTQSFREAFRVLKKRGVLTVMFTHKRVDAWDTLGQALLEAGFSIHSSWPVHTESEHSLHQAKKNSAASTIFLTCRKRGDTSSAYWADIRADVAAAARNAAAQFSAEGMSGIDLTISAFGPVLSVLSRSWPVFTGELDEEGNPQILRPDVALDLAREEVSQLKKRGLLGGRDVEFDRISDWYLLAWADFKASEFPYDEGRKLSIALHLEMDDLAKVHKVVKAASGSVTILTPAQRRTAGGLDPDAASWPTLIDALHALMLIYAEEGLAAAKAWLSRTGIGDDQKFRDLVEAAINAIPRVKEKGEFVRPEAAALEGLRSTIFDDIAAPADPDQAHAKPAQLFELD